MKKILITGVLHPIALQRFEEEQDIEVNYQPDLPFAEILKIIESYDCILSRSETDINQELLDHGKNLSVIARAAVGIGNIDVEYATKKGILVFNTPGKNTNSAAELALMLMLSVIRNLTLAHTSMADNHWNRHQFTGTELQGKTIGLIGLGNVGHRVARFLNSFDCNVISYDPYVSKEYCEKHRTQQVTLDKLIEISDIISIHTPKNKETINMIDHKEIDRMKDGVVLINTARGGLLNEAALVEALERKKIAGAGIDTWDIEPVIEHPLKNYENVVMTPHIGASTHEAQERIAESVSENTIKALKGQIVSSPINLPEINMFGGQKASTYSELAGRLGAFSCQYLNKDFYPKRIEFLYRGNLDVNDWALIKLTYLKEFLNSITDFTVSYVNAMQVAENRGLEIIEKEDKEFSDYESAIRITIIGENGDLSIGGTVFGRNNQRISYVNGFVFEVAPQGLILAIEATDSPGVIGHVGTVLATNNINIKQFEFSRDQLGKHAMALVVVDDEVSDTVIEELKNHHLFDKVAKINL
jgi:D-3-phosphoglycerate dehydrogenase / 2-oxoglutarate reductase